MNLNKDDVHNNLNFDFEQSQLSEIDKKFEQSPAKRLMSDEFDFDHPEINKDHLQEGSSALNSAKEGSKKIKKREPDQLDEIIDKLQIMAVGYGFPEPGNLRSKNKKEIKKTIKWFSSMLSQRDSDIRFRKNVGEKFRKVQLELSTEMRRNQVLWDKKAKLDREVASTENKLVTKEDEIREESYKNKQELDNANRMINEYKYKIKMMEKEMNRKDLEIKEMNQRLRKQDQLIEKYRWGDE